MSKVNYMFGAGVPSEDRDDSPARLLSGFRKNEVARALGTLLPISPSQENCAPSARLLLSPPAAILFVMVISENLFQTAKLGGTSTRRCALSVSR